MLLEKNRLLPPVIRMLSTPHSRKRPRIAIPIAIGTAFQVHCGGNGNETSQSRSPDCVSRPLWKRGDIPAIPGSPNSSFIQEP